jgi:subtilisin family serine protease
VQAKPYANHDLQAIRYAVSKWQVDIISMSFGYELEVEVVHEALKFAEANNVLLIAAASNVGCNTARARRWPGNRFNVLSMCATEGNGYPYKNNPPHKHNAWNFATLGVMVPTWSKPEYMTGTSIATPIAAGIAASVIELVRSTEREYLARYPEHQSRLKAAKDAMSRAENMGKIFGHMAHKKGGYDYLHPSNLLTRTMTPVKLLEAILDKLEE